MTYLYDDLRKPSRCKLHFFRETEIHGFRVSRHCGQSVWGLTSLWARVFGVSPSALRTRVFRVQNVKAQQSRSAEGDEILLKIQRRSQALPIFVLFDLLHSKTTLCNRLRTRNVNCNICTLNYKNVTALFSKMVLQNRLRKDVVKASFSSSAIVVAN